LQLFGGPVAWKANKQDTVTTSTTEAELLAYSQTAKEAIFLSRLFTGLRLRLNEPLEVVYDNSQTVQLVTEESAKLTTKLRHVDIHNHWLRQEHQTGRVQFRWIATAEMPADGLTKSLPRQKHEKFVRVIGMEDIKGQLDMEERMEALKDKIKEARLEAEGHHEVYFVYKAADLTG